MSQEEKYISEQVEDIQNDEVNPEPSKKGWRVAGFSCLGLLGICGLLNFLGIFTFSLDPYAGSITITDLYLVELDESTGEVAASSQTEFESIDRIGARMTSTGIDLIVTMRWIHDDTDTVMFELTGRPKDGIFGTFLEGRPTRPLEPGKYRVEAAAGNFKASKTIYFNVKDHAHVVSVIPDITIPNDHVLIEKSPWFEVPFVFDDEWEISDDDWIINEVKITFFEEDVFFVIVVDSEIDTNVLTDQEIRDLVKPIAQYAIDQGHYDQAKMIEIEGERYNFDNLSESIVVTLYNTNKEAGYRTRFNYSDFR